MALTDEFKQKHNDILECIKKALNYMEPNYNEDSSDSCISEDSDDSDDSD